MGKEVFRTAHIFHATAMLTCNFFQGVYCNKSKWKKVSFVLDIPNTCAIQHCGCGFLLVQSAAAAVRLRDEGEESKAMVMALPASPLPPSEAREARMAHGSGRDPGLCAPVIWEMRKMRRRRRRKRGKATEWCSFQNKFPRVERGAERERGSANPRGLRLSRIMKSHNFSVLNLQNLPFCPASLTSSDADRQGVSIGHTIERTLNFEFEI